MFKPMISNFTIKELKSKHIVQCIKIADEQLGGGYFTEADISLALNNDENFFCAVATIAEDTVGFVFNKIISIDDFAKELKITTAELPTFVRNIPTQKIAVIKTVAVAKKYQGYGVGFKLVENICDKLIQNESVLASIAWKKAEISTDDPLLENNSGKINIGHILENHKFESLIEIPNFWTAESEAEGFICPHCKDICNCSAVIYYRAN